jgi:non-homologous end joining protein Ku
MSKPRAYVGSFTMHFGPATTSGRLLAIRTPDKAPKLHYCTPDGQPVRQCYVDDNEKVYFHDELGRAVMDDEGNLVPVNADAVDQAKTSELPLNVLNLTAHNTEDVEKFLFPSNNNAYIFEPVIKNASNKIIDDPVNTQWHDFLNVLVRDSESTFIGRCNLRNHEGLFRLSHYQGYIVIQKMLYPEDLNQYEPIRPELDQVVKDKALSVVSAMTQPFDPSTYNNVITERLIQAASEDFDPSSVVTNSRNETSGIDLSDALDSFLS